MPIQRINFTNRKRLTRDHANVVIHPAPAADAAAPATFEVQLDLGALRPHADAARVFKLYEQKPERADALLCGPLTKLTDEAYHLFV